MDGAEIGNLTRGQVAVHDPLLVGYPRHDVTGDVHVAQGRGLGVERSALSGRQVMENDVGQWTPPIAADHLCVHDPVPIDGGVRMRAGVRGDDRRVSRRRVEGHHIPCMIVGMDPLPDHSISRHTRTGVLVGARRDDDGRPSIQGAQHEPEGPITGTVREDAYPCDAASADGRQQKLGISVAVGERRAFPRFEIDRVEVEAPGRRRHPDHVSARNSGMQSLAHIERSIRRGPRRARATGTTARGREHGGADLKEPKRGERGAGQA